MLFWLAIDLLDHISNSHIWQHFVLVRVIVDSKITIKLNLASIRCKLNSILRELDSHGIKDSSRHLARYKTVPDKGIKFELVFVQVLSDAFWCIKDTRWTNGFVGILST